VKHRAEGPDLPVALSSAVLLGLVRISIDWTGLGEELGDHALLLAIVVARVVTIAKLVGAGHCRTDIPSASTHFYAVIGGAIGSWDKVAEMIASHAEGN